MKRRLFAILSALSLLLFVAVVVMWVRSYGYSEHFGHVRLSGDWTRNPRSADLVQAGPSGLYIDMWYAGSERGKIVLCAACYVVPQPTLVDIGVWQPTDKGWIKRFGTRELLGSPPDYFGFGFQRADVGFGPEWQTSVPHWAIALVSLWLPWRWLRANLRSLQRDRTGLCPSCGYDLRATPDRCPECGAVPAKAPA